MPTVLITGAARRVGRAIALEFARAGCDLVLTYRESATDIQAVFDAAESLGVRARVDRLDMADVAATEEYAERLVASVSRLDVVVHNASEYSEEGPDGPSAAAAERAYRVNALSPLLLSTRLAPRLARSDLPHGGAIVAMCDIHAMGEHSLPRRGFLPYAMSKAALAEMVRGLARELAPAVRVNGVAPGVVAWPERGAESDAAMQRDYLARVPLKRAGTPEDAARTVRWLALDAGYVTGEIVRLDGGRNLL